jgi:hypothetical protein
MAKLVITDHTLTVALSLAEKLQVMRRNIAVPRWAILGVRAVADGMAEVRGVQSAGTDVPGVVRAGLFKDGQTSTFAMCRGRGPAVLIDLSGQPFDRLLVTVDDPDTVVARLA